MTDPCRMGEQCRRRDARSGEPSPAGERGFCLPCERHGQFAISELPGDWRRLHEMIGVAGGGFAVSIPSGQVDPPIPLRVSIDAIMRDINWTLIAWELAVRDKARLSAVSEHGVRAEVEVPRAAATLVTHYDTLLSLPPTDYLDYAIGPHTMDGPAAMMSLTRLHHLARSAIGDSRRCEKRTLPCPPEPISSGCGEATLVELIGEGGEGLPNPVQCQTCGWVTDADQYAAYARLLIPQGRRPFV